MPIKCFISIAEFNSINSSPPARPYKETNFGLKSSYDLTEKDPEHKILHKGYLNMMLHLVFLEWLLYRTDFCLSLIALIRKLWKKTTIFILWEDPLCNRNHFFPTLTNSTNYFYVICISSLETSCCELPKTVTSWIWIMLSSWHHHPKEQSSQFAILHTSNANQNAHEVPLQEWDLVLAQNFEFDPNNGPCLL